VTAVNDIEKRIPFSHDDRLGFLTFCPTNLGTTVRASVHIKVPKLAADKAKLEEVAGKYNLQVSVPLKTYAQKAGKRCVTPEFILVPVLCLNLPVMQLIPHTSAVPSSSMVAVYIGL
jgi:hypothetical protein